MKTTKRFNQSNSKSKSPSPRERSRSREREIEEEREKNGVHIHHTFKNHNNIEEGKLYLANIPLNIPQNKIKEEFENYGRILDYSFRKKTDVPNPYYYGYITLSQKSEAEEAMINITKNFNWTVMPFNRDTKERNIKNKNLNNNLNNLLYCKNNNREDSLSSDYENNNLNNKLINFIKVREIWVKNLPLSANEINLYKEFFIYGEISKIDLKTFGDTKSAFIKYRLINSAIKALEKANNMDFNGNIINITFSNPTHKKDIIGNELGYELTENNCKLIVACFNRNIECSNEETACNIFENFGKIKNIIIKNISDINHIFIEYYKCEDAKRAVEEMNTDVNIENRKILGDENCEINFYFKNKLNQINPILIEGKNINTNFAQNNMNNNILFNNMMMHGLPKTVNYGNNNPALIFQLLQKNLLNNQFNFNKLNNNINNNLQNKCQNSFNQIPSKIFNFNNNLIPQNYNNNSVNNMQLNNINLSNPLYNIFNNNTLYPKTSLPYIQPQIFPNLQGNNFQQTSQNLQNMNQNATLNQNQLSISLLLNNPCISNIINNSFKNLINLNPNIKNNNNNSNKENNTKSNDVKDLLNKIMLDKENKKTNNNSDSDISSVNGSQSAEEMDFEKEYSLEEENLKYIWNGILTKNKKDKVNVDVYKIRGNIDDNYFKGFHLNICNRIQYEEVMKKHLLGIVAISPQNVTQREIFDQYINYLNERQRCGVINLSEKCVLYLASPGEFSNKFYINPKKHLLGLLADTTVQSLLYIDMNNLALPPPVISMTEKRRLMNKNKKNDHSKDNNNCENDPIKVLKEQLKINEHCEENEKEKFNNVNELIKQNPKIKEIIEKLNKNNTNE